jgi:hypothetical protein
MWTMWTWWWACEHETVEAPQAKDTSPSDSEPTTDTVPSTTPPDTCEPDACGTVWTGTAWLTCEPCRTDEAIAAAMFPVDNALDLMFERSFMPDIVALDRDAIRAHAAEAFQAEPDDDRATLTALNRVVQGFANGHSGLLATSGACADAGGAQPHLSVHEACLEPLGDGFVVTRGSDALALQPGDQITAVNGLQGDALVDWVVDGPLCATGAGTRSTAHTVAAASLLGLVSEGDVLTVAPLEGSPLDVVVPAPGDPTWCGTDTTRWISGHQRSDGVAVITITRFILYPGEDGYVPLTNDASVALFVDNMLAQAQVVFDAVAPGAAGLVWDIRGNGGGITYVALALAGGTPGTDPGVVATCWGRIPGSDPIAYFGLPLVLTLEHEPRFGFEGPVAVLTDGNSVSAADYFAYTHQQRTDARLFGTTTFGAFGGSSLATPLEGAEHLALGVDSARCDDADGVPLETRSVEPHEWVEPAPSDVAAGVDTVLEHAVGWILGP